MRKVWFKISPKIVSKMFNIVQGDYRDVIALKWFELIFSKSLKSRYFCGRILARILRSRKVYEVFHVCSLFSGKQNIERSYYLLTMANMAK